MISYVPKKIHNINIVVWSCCSKRLLSGIHYFVIFICDSASHKASNIGITRENEKTSDISYMPGVFSDKVIDLK